MSSTPTIAAPPARGRRAGEPMKNRVVRCDDATWDSAKDRAKADGLDLSEVIRHYLREYGAGR